MLIYSNLIPTTSVGKPGGVPVAQCCIDVEAQLQALDTYGVDSGSLLMPLGVLLVQRMSDFISRGSLYPAHNL